MKLLFIYPAKAYLLDAPRINPEAVTIEGVKLFKYTGYNVYATVSKPVVRAAYNEAEGSNHYFIELAEGILSPFSRADNDEHMAERIAYSGAEQIQAIINNAKEVLADIPAYEAKQCKIIAEQKAARELQEAENKAKALAIELEAKEAHKNALESALQDFKSGDMIKADYFEELCKQYGVKMPMQTVGALRRSVSKVGASNMQVYGKSRPWGVLEAAKELRAVI